MKFQFGFLFPLSKNTHPTRDFSRIADKVVLKFLAGLTRAKQKMRFFPQKIIQVQYSLNVRGDAI